MASLLPPTRNDLSAIQRSQAIRITRKLEKVLGSVPTFDDEATGYGYYEGPVRLELPSEHSRRSRDDFSPTSSVSSSSSSEYSSSSSTRSSSRASCTHSSFDEKHRSHRDEKPRTHSAVHRPPLLRLVSNAYRSEHSPTYSAMPDTVHVHAPSRHTLDDGSSRSMRSLSSGLDIPRQEKRLSIPNPPEFRIPTEGSVRRAKMERIRRTLGDGVPVELVYARREAPAPVESEDESSCFDPTASIRPFTKSTRPRDVPTASRPAPSPPKSSTSYSSPHRTAKVVEPTSSNHKVSLMRSPVEEPRSTISRSSSSSSSSFSRSSTAHSQRRHRDLGAIAESAEDEAEPSRRTSSSRGKCLRSSLRGMEEKAQPNGWKMPPQSRVPVPAYV